MPRDIFGEIRNQKPGDMAYLGADGTWQTVSNSFVSNLISNTGSIRVHDSGLVTIGDSHPEQDSNLLVYSTAASPSTIAADFRLETTGGTGIDSGAMRAVARQLVSGDASIRAGEFHAQRGGTASSNFTTALEVSVASEIAGDGVFLNNGIRIDSNGTVWGLTGVRNDCGILILGADGWTHPIRVLDTNASTVLFDIDQNGNMTLAGTLPAHGASVHTNRTRNIPLELAAGALTAGTGTLNVSTGLRITFVDGETGTRRWQVPIPADLVTGTVTLCWQWDTAVTSGDVAWQVALGSTGAGVAHSAVNVLAATTVAATVNGTTTLQTISTQVSSSNVTAGRGDIAVFLSRLGADAADTVAGGTDVHLRAVWIEYTADM